MLQSIIGPAILHRDLEAGQQAPEVISDLAVADGNHRDGQLETRDVWS